MGKSGTTRSWTFRAGVGALVAGTVLAVGGLSVAPAGADHVDPVNIVGNNNPDCGDLGYTYEFKINSQPSNQIYPVTEAQSGIVGGGSVTISNAGVDHGVFYFDFASTIAWDAVIVKQGNAGASYTYVPPSTGDTDLHPSTTDGEPDGAISHVSFCRDDATTTTSEETTTTEDTTTTTEGTTTSETVLGTTVTQGESTTSETVKGVVVERQLPRTGATSELMTYAAMVLIASGMALLATSKRSLSAHR